MQDLEDLSAVIVNRCCRQPHAKRSGLTELPRRGPLRCRAAVSKLLDLVKNNRLEGRFFGVVDPSAKLRVWADVDVRFRQLIRRGRFEDVRRQMRELFRLLDPLRHQMRRRHDQRGQILRITNRRQSRDCVVCNDKIIRHVQMIGGVNRDTLLRDTPNRINAAYVATGPIVLVWLRKASDLVWQRERAISHPDRDLPLGRLAFVGSVIFADICDAAKGTNNVCHIFGKASRARMKYNTSFYRAAVRIHQAAQDLQPIRRARSLVAIRDESLFRSNIKAKTGDLSTI